MEIPLKYGCNPNQTHARLLSDRSNGPLSVVSGNPSFINMLDALRGWQLVRELAGAANKPAAASFKHVSPAGAAVAGPIDDALRQAHFYDEADLSPLATAYAKARSSDRAASFGDFIAVSDRVDITLARLIKPEVSDGIIAPSYDDDARDLLATKKGGGYIIMRMDPDYEPSPLEMRTEFGLTLEQDRNESVISRDLLHNVVSAKKNIPDDVIETLIVATVTLKHTQSNSVAVGWGGQAVGIGAGQQSRIACTRLACGKADRWFLKLHPKTLSLVSRLKADLARPVKVNLVDQFARWEELGEGEKAMLREAVDGEGGGGIEPITPEERESWIASFKGVVCSSDAFFPFRDNLDRCAQTGVKYVLQAGGSKRDADVIAAADEHDLWMAFSGLRLFLH